MFTMHVLNNWALDYADLVEGSEDWLDIPIITGESESGEVVVLTHVRNCMPKVENAARQNDGGADCPLLLRARAYSQIINDNTLKVVKKKTKTTTSTQVGWQKRKLREDSKPSGAGVQVEKPPSSDEDSHGNSRAPVISPIHSPPAKQVRRQEMPGQVADWGSRPVCNVQGGPTHSGWESQDGQHPHNMTQGPEFECGLEQGLNSCGMSQQQHTQDDAGSTHLMGSHLTGLIPWNDTNIRNHNNYNTDVNMYDEAGHDDAFMDKYHATRFEPSFSMQDHHH